MKPYLLITSALMVAALLTTPSNASCRCACVDGEMKGLCSSSLDIEPICPPTICGITPPSIAPLQIPGIPPIGASSCRQAQVANPYNGRYEWKTVCN
jgi:hypothetical protein